MLPTETSRFLDFVTGARALLRRPQLAEELSVGEVLKFASADAEDAQTARHLLSEGLQAFPLHPYLLSWRANAAARVAIGRIGLLGSEGSGEAADEAEHDLRTAMLVAPDYEQPKMELAFHILNYKDDPGCAEQLFRELVASVSTRLCECIAGMVMALRELGLREAADRELARWLEAFPESKELTHLSSARS